ncbi:hypothetical protein NL676_033297 [Syzygium grande]|nr:hypothetical protein NL676_033297 [Syzygium grande]
MQIEQPNSFEPEESGKRRSRSDRKDEPRSTYPNSPARFGELRVRRESHQRGENPARPWEQKKKEEEDEEEEIGIEEVWRATLYGRRRRSLQPLDRRQRSISTARIPLPPTLSYLLDRLPTPNIERSEPLDGFPHRSIRAVVNSKGEKS